MQMGVVVPAAIFMFLFYLAFATRLLVNLDLSAN